MVENIILSLFLLYCHITKISVEAAVSSKFNSVFSENPYIEIRGVFYPCTREFRRSEKNGLEAINNEESDKLTKCSRKFFINIKFNNRGPNKFKDELILLDHIYDPIINASSRLLNPIVFKVSQEQILEVYDLKFLKLLNGEAKENIYQQNVHSKVCGHSSIYMPCGSQHFKIPHRSNNHGHCCSCKSSFSQNSKHGKNHKKFNSHQSDSSSLHTNNNKTQYYPSNTDQIEKGEYNILPEVPTISPIATIPNENFREKRNRFFKETPSIVIDDSTKDQVDEEWTRKLVERNDKHSFSMQDMEPLTMYSSPNKPLNKFENYEMSGEEKVYNENEVSSTKHEGKHAIYSWDATLPSNNKFTENSWNVAGDTGVNKDENRPHERMNNFLYDDVRHVKYIPVYASDGEKLSKLSFGLPVKINIGYEPQRSSKNLKNHFDRLSSGINTDLKTEPKPKGSKHKICGEGETVTIHCLNFSKLWYAAYEIINPSYRHVIHLQILEKYHDLDGSKFWIDHTERKMISLGSFDEDSKEQVTYNESLKYKVLEIEEEQKSIVPNVHRLLVPQPVPEDEITTYPEATGNPAEFLVLNEDLISLNGNECDKAGIGIEAFIAKKGRCTARNGTCLRNQPAALWRQDKEARNCGQKSQYFLENFGHVTKNSFQTNKMDKDHILTFEFYGKHVSQVDVAVPGGYNYVVRRGMPAQITVVTVDASRESPPSLTVGVANLGLASAFFTVQFGECSPPLRSTYDPTFSMKSSFGSLKSKKIMISSLHQADFVIDLGEDISVDKMFCIVKVLNDNNDTVAARHVTVRKGGRCICVWHCRCNCIKSMINLKCKLMSYSEVHASGLKGTVPVHLPATPVEYIVIVQEDDDDLFVLYLFLTGMLLFLLLLGCSKAVLGLTFWKSIWMMGIPYYSGPKLISQYREPELADRQVQYDKAGYPVHPDTKKRTVRLYNRWVEFILNIFIFLVFPILALIWWPICCCFSLLCKNFIGYRWRFSASKQDACSSLGTSETSTFDPEDFEDERKSSSNSKSSNERKTGNASVSDANERIRERNLDQGESRRDNRDRHGLKKSQSSESERQENNTRMAEAGSSTSVMSQDSESIEPNSTFTSHVSIETYDGTADEQEVSDVEYVLKQLRRSSSEIQKSHEKLYGERGMLPSDEGTHRSRRGEILQEVDSSSRLESSSEDSIPVDLIRLRNMDVIGDENYGGIFKSHSGAGEPSNGPVSSARGDTFSEVTTKDSLEAISEDDAKKSSSAALDLVKRLHSKRVIFRNIVKPIGQTSFPPGQPYSIRGYFLKTNGGYKFIPPTPLWQYWTLDEDGANMMPVEPPLNLFSGEFEKDYPNAQSVVDSGDLSELPLSTCINVQFQNFDFNTSLEEMVK